jgi:hypothetical protein
MNDSITFDSNMYAKHDKMVELTNSLSNEEKCLLITTLATSMKENVDVLLTDKDDNVKAVFGCKNTWLTASLNGLQPVFSFEFDHVSMIRKGKDSIDKHITKHLENKKEG